MSRLLKSYCVGHTLPLFAPSVPFEMLCPTSLGIANEVVIDDNRFGYAADGSNLAEYSQLFGLYDLLLSGEVVADDLFLFQYRKFLSPTPGGGAESVAPWIRVLTPVQAHATFPSLEQLDAFRSRLAVGSLFAFGESLSSNYARVHVIDDFVLFALACSDSGALTKAEIKAFVSIQGMLPSPALCFIQADLYVRVIRILKTVWEQYGQNYQVVRNDYQRRVAGYLLERLHSFLFFNWLMDNSEPDISIWQRYVVSDDPRAVD